MAQALSVWSELEAAYYGKNRFGGDTAEIYAYRLQPFSPTAVRGNSDSPLVRATQQEAATQAATSLLHLLEFFCETKDCKATVDEGDPRIVLTLPFVHRCHVRIFPKKN
jgi:hypothetical protein